MHGIRKIALLALLGLLPACTQFGKGVAVPSLADEKTLNHHIDTVIAKQSTARQKVARQHPWRDFKFGVQDQWRQYDKENESRRPSKRTF